MVAETEQGDFSPQVTTISATPSAEAIGPTLNDLRYAGQPLPDGSSITQATDLSLAATDPSGVGRVECSIDGIAVGSDQSGLNDRYRLALDPLTLSDGPHSLTLLAYDTLGNSSQLQIGIVIALAAPSAPQLTAPADGLITNQSRLAISGSAAFGSEVSIQRDGVTLAGPTTSGRRQPGLGSTIW